MKKNEKENRTEPLLSSVLPVAGVLLLIILAAILLWYQNANSSQAVRAVAARVHFEGEYRVGNGQWQPIVDGQHIPATKGDVTLRGNFYRYAPDGEYIGPLKEKDIVAFYTDHINVTVYEGEMDPYVIDHENPLYGTSACGVDWTAYSLKSDGTGPIEILLHNSHRFGNETAVDDFLSNVASWGYVDFERDILDSGKFQRNSGVLFLLVSLALVGITLFSALLHLPNLRIIWLIGLTICFAGAYLVYSAPGVSFWSEFIATNTIILGCSMIFYMLFVSGIITHFLQETKTVGLITTTALGIVDGAYILLPVLTGVFFYDTWFFWVITQSLANVVLFGCLLKEGRSANKKKRWGFAGMALLLIAFEADVIATALGWWKGGFLSEYVFVVLFFASLILILRVIPESINTAVKAKELALESSRLEAEKSMIEAELKESRVSIMLSQIQPHFIYNTLGTIERMCLKDPQKAFDLVRNFSLYLRGNFSELDSVTPIRFTEELKHVEYYINIEKVRFADMNIEYDVKATDFVLPALSVQPLVENAIKHGLMRLEEGGTVNIRSYETPTHYCVEVKDDGVGFDTSLPIEEKKHVGLRNIRGRLKAMVNGELIIESKENVGTKATIMIPKETTI